MHPPDRGCHPSNVIVAVGCYCDFRQRVVNIVPLLISNRRVGKLIAFSDGWKSTRCTRSESFLGNMGQVSSRVHHYLVAIKVALVMLLPILGLYPDTAFVLAQFGNVAIAAKRAIVSPSPIIKLNQLGGQR